MNRNIYVLLGALASAIAFAATTAAADPTHQKYSLPETFTVPAGQLCDFDYYLTIDSDLNVIIFGDPSNPTEVIEHDTQSVTHTNLDTGASLSEVDHFTLEFNAGEEREKQVGLIWHLRDASGKLVVVGAGEALVDTSTGELLKFTPNFKPDFAGVICPALGGAPAI